MVHISFLGVKAMIVFLQIMFLLYSIMLQAQKKRKLVKDMERYKRMACTKKRRIDNSERMSAACSLLQLSQDGNGSNFCEPHTGTSTATSMTMCDIEDLERGYHNLEDENK